MIILAENDFEIVIQNEITFNTNININFIKENILPSRNRTNMDSQMLFFRRTTNLWLELFPYLIKVILLIDHEYSDEKEIIKFNNIWEYVGLPPRHDCKNTMAELRRVFRDFIDSN